MVGVRELSIGLNLGSRRGSIYRRVAAIREVQQRYSHAARLCSLVHTYVS